MPEHGPPSLLQRWHVKGVLALYRQHPHTTGQVRKADRLLAAKLYRQGISLDNVRAAFLLVAARRSQSRRQPPSPIRSLHYFLPAIQEVLEQPLDTGYVRYLQRFNRRDNPGRDHHLP